MMPFCRNSKWSGSENDDLGMNIVVISSEDARSLGDALRDLDGKALLRSDFILLYGDTVANIPLLPLLEEHKQVTLST